jgi:DNA recombination protein RmuC
MEIVIPILAAAVAAGIVAIVMRSATARQLAEARAAAAAELAASQQALLEKADQRIRETFQSLASQALNDNRQSFFDLAKTSFEAYRQPIADTLKRVDQRLGDVERERIESYARLSEQIVALGSSATTLANALRTPAVRGRWGELQLRRVVEMAGMLQRCDFDEQPGLFTENGRFRPDLIVHLPGGKQIVVDAKVPLEQYLEAQSAIEDGARTARLQGHARQVRDHMDRLAAKAYWDQLGNSPEIVVMFLPGESLFSAALQHDLTLIEHGLQQRVLLASPLTENYREVARLGKEFYERLATFADRFDEIRKRLDGAVQAYNEAAGSFESRILVSARRLRELEVTTADELRPADPIERVPRVLKQVGLMGLPDEALADAEAGEVEKVP